jgi:hypothetical protein
MRVSQHRPRRCKDTCRGEEEGGVPVLGVVVAMAGDGDNGHGGKSGAESVLVGDEETGEARRAERADPRKTSGPV